MDIIKPRIMKGTRDFLPDDMYIREWVIEIVKENFVRYGFRPLATPAMEYYDILTGKYGVEGEGLIFDMAYKGGKEIALKYDLTVPLCRVIAQYRDKITLPFKRYQIQPVWRAEKPQKGRLREFYQCDADIVGVKSVSQDAEIISLITDIMDGLGFKNYKTLINHRKFLSGVMAHAGIKEDRIAGAMRILDKLDKTDLETVKGEFIEKGFNKKSIELLLELTGDPEGPEEGLMELKNRLSNNAVAIEGIDDLLTIFKLLMEMGIEKSKIVFAPRLARGLAYYTGPVYETIVERPKVGSIAGGGRYDELIGIFSGVDVPATGVALGLERIIEVIKELDMMKGAGDVVQLLVVPLSQDEMGISLKIAHELRQGGINTDVYCDEGRLKKKLKYADRLKIPKVIIVAPDELSRGAVKLKDMKSGEEAEIGVGDIKKAISSGN